MKWGFFLTQNVFLSVQDNIQTHSYCSKLKLNQQDLLFCSIQEHFFWLYLVHLQKMTVQPVHVQQVISPGHQDHWDEKAPGSFSLSPSSLRWENSYMPQAFSQFFPSAKLSTLTPLLYEKSRKTSNSINNYLGVLYKYVTLI